MARQPRPRGYRFSRLLDHPPGREFPLDKALRPFQEATGQIIRAGSSLLGRAVRGEAAYPGLQALIADFYRSPNKGGGESKAAEILEIARIADSVRAWGQSQRLRG